MTGPMAGRTVVITEPVACDVASLAAVREPAFQSNHLAPFLLTALLLPRPRESARDAPVRVITTSSRGKWFGRLRMDDLEWEAAPVRGRLARLRHHQAHEHPVHAGAGAPRRGDGHRGGPLRSVPRAAPARWCGRPRPPTWPARAVPTTWVSRRTPGCILMATTGSWPRTCETVRPRSSLPLCESFVTPLDDVAEIVNNLCHRYGDKLRGGDGGASGPVRAGA